MPIVSHILKTTQQANGQISYELRMSDQDGTVYLRASIVDPGVNIDTLVAQKIAEHNEILAAEEFEQIVSEDR